MDGPPPPSIIWLPMSTSPGCKQNRIQFLVQHVISTKPGILFERVAVFTRGGFGVERIACRIDLQCLRKSPGRKKTNKQTNGHHDPTLENMPGRWHTTAAVQYGLYGLIDIRRRKILIRYKESSPVSLQCSTLLITFQPLKHRGTKNQKSV